MTRFAFWKTCWVFRRWLCGWKEAEKTQIESRRTKGIVQLVTVSTSHVDLMHTIIRRLMATERICQLTSFLTKANFQFERSGVWRFVTQEFKISPKDNLITRGVISPCLTPQ